MWYVYIITSVTSPDQDYVGATSNLKQRLTDHNAGKSPHTSKFRPWVLAWYCAFPNKYRALEFEKYLKSHSGRAFSKKRLIKAEDDIAAEPINAPLPRIHIRRIVLRATR